MTDADVVNAMNETMNDTAPSPPSNPSNTLAAEIVSAILKWQTATGLHAEKIVASSTPIPGVPFAVKVVRAICAGQLNTAKAYSDKVSGRLLGTLLGKAAAECNCPKCRRERGEDEDGNEGVQ